MGTYGSPGSVCFLPLLAISRESQPFDWIRLVGGSVRGIPIAPAPEVFGQLLIGPGSIRAESPAPQMAGQAPNMEKLPPLRVW